MYVYQYVKKERERYQRREHTVAQRVDAEVGDEAMEHDRVGEEARELVERVDAFGRARIAPVHLVKVESI